MFTRDIYQDYIRWDKPGQYSLMPESTHRGADTCFQEIPEMHPNNRQFKISTKNDMANIESDLYNLIRPNAKDPTKHYPFIKKDYSNPPGPLQVCGNNNDFSINYPKLEGSQFNREKSIHIPRFESTCLNPQQPNRIRSNNVIGLNTRLYNRDTHIPNQPVLTEHTNIFIPLAEPFVSKKGKKMIKIPYKIKKLMNKQKTMNKKPKNTKMMKMKKPKMMTKENMMNYNKMMSGMDNSDKLYYKHQMMNQLNPPNHRYISKNAENFCGACAT